MFVGPQKVTRYALLGVVVLLFAEGAHPPLVSALWPKVALPPAVALPSDTPAVEATLRFLERRVKHDPEDFIAYNKLAISYLQRFRETRGRDHVLPAGGRRPAGPGRYGARRAEPDPSTP